MKGARRQVILKKAVNHDQHRDRVRAKVMKNGLDVLEDHEALEALLFYCIPRRNTNGLAKSLIAEFGSLHNLLDASAQEISRRGGITLRAAFLLTLVVPMHKKYSLSKNKVKTGFETSKEIGRYAIGILNDETSECFDLICLDAQRKLINSELIVKGAVDGATFHPRTIVETALKHHAKYVILAHNHPSRRLDPSDEDREATKKVIQALHPIGIEVLDHIIVGGGEYLSFREKNFIV